MTTICLGIMQHNCQKQNDVAVASHKAYGLGAGSHRVTDQEIIVVDGGFGHRRSVTERKGVLSALRYSVLSTVIREQMNGPQAAATRSVTEQLSKAHFVSITNRTFKR